MGRPTVVTKDVLASLRTSFLIGATIDEAVLAAGISKPTYYKYIEKNPEFIDEVDQWRNNPILEAKATIVKNLKRDTNVAKWYLERRAKAEYGNNIDLTTNGKDLPQPILGGIAKEPEKGKQDA